MTGRSTPGDAPEGVLAPYRVLDLTDDLGCLCGKILADLGADVIVVEPPGGSPARNIGPYFHDVPDPEKSLFWFASQTNKRGITLNLETTTGQELFRRLARTADFVIESSLPRYLEGYGLGYELLSRLNPRLILVSITPFGQTGPYRKLRASDLELMAMSGCMSLAGRPEREPLRVSLAQSPGWTGSTAAMGALIAHYHRELTGQGQHVDISAQASLLWVIAHAPLFWDLNRESPQRAGEFISGRSVSGALMRTIWPCKDGSITFTIYGGPAGRKTNQALTEWMDSVGMAPGWLKAKDWSTFDIATVSVEEVARLEAAIAPFFATLTKAEFLEGVVRRDMLGYAVATAEDILQNPQLQARGYWAAIEHPELGVTLPYPGPFARFSAGSCAVRRRAPLIGEHNEEVYGKELGLSAEELIRLREGGII